MFLKIAHKKPECIGCMLCAEVAPEYWVMDEDGAFQYGEGLESDRKILKEAEVGCPVNIIRIG